MRWMTLVAASLVACGPNELWIDEGDEEGFVTIGFYARGFRAVRRL